jgi:hypothetical protein
MQLLYHFLWLWLAVPAALLLLMFVGGFAMMLRDFFAYCIKHIHISLPIFTTLWCIIYILVER